MNQMIEAPLVRLDADLGADKGAVISALADIVAGAGRTQDTGQLLADVLARESTSATGLPGGIAIPHCRTAAVDEPTLAFARLAPPVDFGAKDGPADLAFLIAAPAGGDADHLKILTKLARALVRKDFTDSLRNARSADEVVALVNGVVSDAPPAAAASAAAPAAAAAAAAPVASGAPRRLVAVTACPTGIAHTYMAAEALEASAKKAGVEIAVETQGSAGSHPLDPAVISAAEAVIFACDVGVRDRSRFAGKPMVNSGVKRAIDDPDGMITEALRYADNPASAPKVEGTASESAGPSGNESWAANARRVLMTGVSYMIPFVAAGGLMIALAFLFGGDEIAGKFVDISIKNSLFDLPDTKALGLDHALFHSGLMAYIGSLFFVIGKAAFALFVPALAGYIAYAIADRPGLAPGFVMGALASNLMGFATSDATPKSLPATGYLGAIAGGVLAGIIARWIAGWRVPAWARGLMPVLVIPLLTSVLAGFVMLIVLNRPIQWLMDELNSGLVSLQGGSAVVLGIVVGLMMAFDMGGPLNKVAYSLAAAGVGAAATASYSDPRLELMAAVMIAGMVPPIALALSSAVRPHLYTPAERENGKAAWALGASFITEGAIPFAAADPIRVIPSIMTGSAVAGALSMAFHVSQRAPHGGIFILPFAVHNFLGFVIALVAGVLVAAALVTVLKSFGPSDADELAL